MDEQINKTKPNTLTFYGNHKDRKTCVATYINTHYEPIKQTPADVAILMIFSVLGLTYLFISSPSFIV
jgi:hypothetical protein